MRIKDGVMLSGLHFMLWYAAAVVDYLRQAYGFGEATLTSALDPAPGRVRNTLHPKGLAIDVRTRDMPPAQIKPFATVLTNALGPSFDVVVEADHIHIEYLLVV